jgi:hypothetical protein
LPAAAADTDLRQIGFRFESRDASARAHVHTANDAEGDTARNLVRIGRQLKDGSRRGGGRVVRSFTAMLPPERIAALKIEALRRDMTGSEIIDLALASIGIGVEPLTNRGQPGKRAATPRTSAAKKKPAKKSVKKKRAA